MSMIPMYYWHLNRNRRNYGYSSGINPIPVLILTGAIFAGTLGLTAYFLKQEEKEQEQIRVECSLAEDKYFDEGEHIIAVAIENPTKEVKEYIVPEGYKALGISTSAYGKGGYVHGDSYILYENTTPVMAQPTYKKEDGEFIYENFGTPITYETTERKETEDTITYKAGEHLVSVPFRQHHLSAQFTSYEGYEPIGMANSTYGQGGKSGNYGCILYVNTEDVVVKKNIQEGELPFGTPVAPQKTK